MKKHKQPEELSVAKIILLSIAKTLVWGLEQQKYSYASILGADCVAELKRRNKERELRRTLAYLRKRKLIEAREKGDLLLVNLTPKGLCTALKARLKFETIPFANETKCFVAFDIPESQRHARRQFRLFLRECGFEKLQQSVWATNKNVAQPLLEFAKASKVEEWVKIIVGSLAK